MEKIAIYPGSFDPVTNGHLDIVERGLKVFDKVIVTVLHNPAKKTLFTVEERLDMLRISLKDFPNAEVASYNGLLIDYAILRNVNAILRGMRAISDFEYEFQMALMNHNLNDKVETLFLTTSSEYAFLSSTIIKSVIKLNGRVSGLVSKKVENALIEKFGL